MLKEDNNTISIIIRTLNEEENILKCLDCLSSQTLLPNEVLIVDNGSTDKTLELIHPNQYSFPIKIIKITENGFTPGLNKGFDKSVGQFIVFISADCYANSNWLESLLTTQSKYNADVVQGNEIAAPPNDIHFVINYFRKVQDQAVDEKIVFFNNTNTLYKRGTLSKFMPFKEEKGRGGEGGEDTLMSIVYAENGYTAYKSADAIVNHNMFPNWDDFKKRALKHGKTAFFLFQKQPLHPRIYLNAYYWSLKEFMTFLVTGDRRFYHVAKERFKNNLRGLVNVIIKK
ncbi:glycosyltransferase family 2 protein [candidate division WWE3 bacterium]|nr:glycosyltransferase family 2 protein [candidate division WWE3 bacterium]